VTPTEAARANANGVDGAVAGDESRTNDGESGPEPTERLRLGSLFCHLFFFCKLLIFVT
jgi:hypothetical protein